MLQDHKVEIFKEELELIPVEYYRRWTEACIRVFPDYMFEIAASDSRLHHPKWALGPGGLVRHTKAVTKLAFTLAGTMLPKKSEEDVYTKQLSSIVSACILHDSCKYGIPFDYRMSNLHPYIPRVMFSKIQNILSQVEANFIFTLVESHMGSYNNGDWSPNNHLTTDTLRKHVGALIVHQADYLASRNDYIDARFQDINADVERSDFVLYEPFPDNILKGIIIGTLLGKGFDLETLSSAENKDNLEYLFSRIAALRQGSSRRYVYNYDHILEKIEDNIPLFFKLEEEI